MFRKAIFKNIPGHHHGFDMRGREVKRIESFSDAVFAFAVTLLIVSLEVPKNFDELLVSMRAFFAFGICFSLLMIVWFEQYIFFRRYGLEDTTTIVLNCFLMFVVLFYVYPLKFLFTLVFSENIYGAGKSPFAIRDIQVPTLMVIYGFGYIIIHFILLLMYLHVLGNKVHLQLTTLELFDTHTKIHGYLILIIIGTMAIFTALLLPLAFSGFSGFVYVLIGIALTVYHTRRGKKRREVFHPHEVRAENISE